VAFVKKRRELENNILRATFYQEDNVLIFVIGDAILRG
jgi:hypothetical protein